MIVARRNGPKRLTEKGHDNRFGTCVIAKERTVIMSNIKSQIAELMINLVYIGIPVIVMSGFVTAVSPLSA